MNAPNIILTYLIAFVQFVKYVIFIDVFVKDTAISHQELMLMAIRSWWQFEKDPKESDLITEKEFERNGTKVEKGTQTVVFRPTNRMSVLKTSKEV